MRASDWGRNVAEKPRGMRLKFVLSQLRTYTHESKNMFVFFKSLRFYGEQDSVESNPGGVTFNLVSRSHSGRGTSGYEMWTKCTIEDELNIDGGKYVLALFLNYELFWIYNKTIIEFGFRITWRIMEISEDVIQDIKHPPRSP